VSKQTWTSEWEERRAMVLVAGEVDRAEGLGGTFSCESAEDLRTIAARSPNWGISNRDAALLRYYAERIDCENGAATTLDNAIAKALLSIYEGTPPSVALVAIREAIDEWERNPQP